MYISPISPWAHGAKVLMRKGLSIFRSIDADMLHQTRASEGKGVSNDDGLSAGDLCCTAERYSDRLFLWREEHWLVCFWSTEDRVGAGPLSLHRVRW